jgi:hypothetical protein
MDQNIVNDEVDTLEEPQKDTAVECECTCQGECQCGKYKTIRHVYYEVDVNQYINALNDWD